MGLRGPALPLNPRRASHANDASGPGRSRDFASSMSRFRARPEARTIRSWTS